MPRAVIEQWLWAYGFGLRVWGLGLGYGVRVSERLDPQRQSPVGGTLGFLTLVCEAFDFVPGAAYTV